MALSCLVAPTFNGSEELSVIEICVTYIIFGATLTEHVLASLEMVDFNDYPQSYHQFFLQEAWWYDFYLVSLHLHF